MSIKIKAKERKIKLNETTEIWRYVMIPELYSQLSQEKVVREETYPLADINSVTPYIDFK